MPTAIATFVAGTGLSFAAGTLTAEGVAMTVSGAGFALLPAGPGVGTVVTTGTANVYGSYVEFRGATGNAVYIVGVNIRAEQTGGAPSYYQIAIGTGAAASETQVTEWRVASTLHDSTIGSISQNIVFPAWIQVAASTRIALKAAANVSSNLPNIALIVIDVANVS